MNPKMQPLLAVGAESKNLTDRADKLAETLDLPRSDINDPDYPLILAVTAERLELRQTGAGTPGPIYADFLHGPAGYRLRHGGGRSQPLAKAVGLKGGHSPYIIDATAGLGRDAFVLASLGCQVYMLERSPIIAVLLEDGLRRAALDRGIGEIIRQRMNFIHGDSIKQLEKLIKTEKAAVIYLDPMYPGRIKSALVKKEMRAVRALVGDDTDAPELLQTALECTPGRIVVKRPGLAPALIRAPKPSMVIRNKNSRYDIYLT